MEPYIPDDMRKLYVFRFEDARTRLAEARARADEERHRSHLLSGSYVPVNEQKVENVPRRIPLERIDQLRETMREIGFHQSELDRLIEWEAREVSDFEKQTLTQLVRIVANMFVDKAGYDKN